MSTIHSVSTYDVERYAEELAAAPDNRVVGTELIAEQDGIKLWTIRLKPGERVAFHAHARPYLWCCTSGSDGAVRHPNGSIDAVRFNRGDMSFKEIGEEPVIHDLENTGTDLLSFVTLELPAG